VNYPTRIAPFVDGVSTADLPLQTTYGYTGCLSRAEHLLWRRACQLAYDALPHWVYWHFAADGRLLYVGSTTNLDERTGQHRYSCWWGDVERIVSTRFETRTAGLAAEAAAIKAGRPLYNVQHNPDAELARARLAEVAA
jgi:predicted GIY-YIG superfamily endonuclease